MGSIVASVGKLGKKLEAWYDAMAAVENAGVDGVLHLEGGDDGAGGEYVELQASARHLVDALGVIEREFMEDVFRRPCRLELPRNGLSARDIWRCDHACASKARDLEEFTTICRWCCCVPGH